MTGGKTNTKQTAVAPSKARSRKRVVIVALLLTAFTAAWWWSPLSARYRYERADLVTLSRITEARPKDALAWRTLGLRLATQTDPLAEKPLSEAYALNQSDYEVATALGGLLLSFRRYAEAYQILRRTTELFPDYVPARIALGRLYQVRGAHQKAAEQYDAVIRVSKEDAATWYDLAECYSRTLQADKARKAIAEALRIRPRDPKYLALQGTLQTVNGDVAEGLRNLTDAATLAPDEMPIQGALLDALVKYQRGPDDLRQAGQVMDRMYQTIPNAPRLMYLRGELARLSGDIPGAIKQLERVRAAVPQLDDTYYSLGRAYQQAGRTKQAELTLAAYRTRKELRVRIDELRVALGGRPDDIGLLTQLADMQVKIDDLSAALDTLESAVRLDPTNPRIQSRMVSLRNMLGQKKPGS